MSDKPEVYNRLLQQFYDGFNTDEVLQALKQLEGLQGSGELSTKERYELQVHAFRTLRELTAETPDVAEVLILEYLLPQCLVTHPDASIELHQHRECLADWLNQYPETVRHDLRDKVLDRLYQHLQSSEPVVACWLVSRIGYRTDEVVDALWNIVRQDDDEIGDTAIHTLTSLGVPLVQREPILSELHRRAASRYNHSLVSALAQLADPSSIRVVFNHWLTPDTCELKPIYGSLVFNIPRCVLDARSDNAALQDEVWQLLTDLAEERPDEFSHEFYLGKTAPSCNSVLVVPVMLEWLGKETEGRNNPAWGRYLIGLRLEECVRPRQLKGWEQSLNTAAIELLRQDACQDTGVDGFWTTEEDMVKKKAWETVLRAGHADALNWFDEAVVSETGRFLQQKIIECFALFRFESLPEIIMKWITEEYDELSARKDSREFMRRMAAFRMARSSASREAFDALLNFGFTHQGKAMMQSVYALTEVALHLIGNGDTSVVDELVEAAVDRAQEHQRAAAAYALDHIAFRFPSLLLKHADRIVPTLYDPRREHYERGTLISVLGQLSEWQIPDELLRDMEVWAHESDGWVQGSSLEALARHERLHKCHDLLSKVLRLQRVGEKWDLEPNVERFKGAPHIIGLLYHNHPEAFTPAIASLVRTLDWLSIPQVFETLRYSHGEPNQSALPRAIKDALVERIREKQSRTFGETEIFRLLAELTPKELTQEQWRGFWDNWLPDSRAALADALGEANLESATRGGAISHLQSLTGDGQYAVRRAAYRGLARQSMDALYRLCLSWSVASNVEVRQRVAEACGWLEGVNTEDGSDAFEKLYQDLVTDREKSVREAAERTWKERRKRLWAEQYLSIIMNVKGQTNEEILAAWRYGEALVHIGDDSCIRALREHLSKESLPPNTRYWIQQIIEKMQENWRKTTREWPEPWFAWEGAVKKGRGKVQIPEEEMYEIEYSIWSQPASALSEKHRLDRWGGAIWPIPPTLLRPGDGMVELEDGRQGRIIIKRIHGDTAIFVGTGPYPT
jgi:hypothetical protein